tara:strand:+ start:525 stop:743 length:219 start_codon:yes stop_codon:yes gene_type:complete
MNSYRNDQQIQFDLTKIREEISRDMKENQKDDGVYFKYAIWSITCMAATASCAAALVLIVMEISKNINTTST